MSSLVIRSTRDKARILAFLEQDRIYHGYAICDLAPPLDVMSDWYGAYTADERMSGLCLHYRGFVPNPLNVMGEPDAVDAILRTVLQPSPVYLICRPEHQATVWKYYQPEHVEDMIRMVVNPASFQPADSGIQPVRLRPTDLGELRELYGTGEGNLFTEYMLRDGVFYGIWQDNRMVAVAGTHCIAPRYGIGAVGNVYTHPAYRGRGYAQICTGVVTCDLFTHHRCRDVILNVNRENRAAQTAYSHLGYRAHCDFIEAPAHVQPDRWPPWVRPTRRRWVVELSNQQLAVGARLSGGGPPEK